jgi:hypothetical protein
MKVALGLASLSSIGARDLPAQNKSATTPAVAGKLS